MVKSKSWAMMRIELMITAVQIQLRQVGVSGTVTF